MARLKQSAELSTAAFGLAVAYLLDRQRFAGKRAFEFMAMLNFAVPGTVVGIAYILAFNAPPIELAYTGLILVACFVFRDMTTSMRAGLAALSQIDPSLDEASATLRAGTFVTVRRVILPPLYPALLTGFALAFARSLGEYGSLVFVSGNMPYKTEIAPVLIVARLQEFAYGEATAIAVVLLAISFAMLVLINLLERWSKREAASA
jgi:ABC-type sulfate transport system permease component